MYTATQADHREHAEFFCGTRAGAELPLGDSAPEPSPSDHRVVCAPVSLPPHFACNISAALVPSANGGGAPSTNPPPRSLEGPAGLTRLGVQASSTTRPPEQSIHAISETQTEITSIPSSSAKLLAPQASADSSTLSDPHPNNISLTAACQELQTSTSNSTKSPGPTL